MTREDELVTRARSRVGRTLRGKYELVALLGVGRDGGRLRGAAPANAQPRRGEDPAPGDLRSTRRCGRRFLREGYAANSVDHPGTVRVLDDDTAEDGCAFLVMELLEGETLEARAERCGGRLPAPEVVTARERAPRRARAPRTRRGIVHRDIKPENVFLTRGGALQGARLRHRAGARATPNAHRATGSRLRDAGVHAAGAGAGARARGGRAVGRVGGGRDDVHAARAAAWCTRPRPRRRRSSTRRRSRRGA